jgi:hypothetical protein
MRLNTEAARADVLGGAAAWLRGRLLEFWHDLQKASQAARPRAVHDAPRALPPSAAAPAPLRPQNAIKPTNRFRNHCVLDMDRLRPWKTNDGQITEVRGSAGVTALTETNGHERINPRALVEVEVQILRTQQGQVTESAIRNASNNGTVSAAFRPWVNASSTLRIRARGQCTFPGGQTMEAVPEKQDAPPVRYWP